jgi:TP901 family phage tail tape measure protein
MADRPLRSLFLELGLRVGDALSKLKATDAAFKAAAYSIEKSADVIERAAERVGAAISSIMSGASSVRSAAAGARGGGGGGAGGGRRGGADPLDAAIRRANEIEKKRAAQAEREERRAAQQAARAAAQADRVGKKRAADHEKVEKRLAAEAERKAASTARTSASAARSDARVGGLAAGSKPIEDATRALGPFAKATDQAKARVADLNAQVERNRKEMAELRAKVIQTGDADGTLTARIQGLSVATGRASVELQKARRELRDLDGGFLKAVKSATMAKVSVVALGTALGNLISGGVSRAFHGVVDGITQATKKAIDFESAFADVKKVLPDNATEAQIKGVEKSIVDLSRRVAVDGPEGAAKLTAALVQTGLYADETGKLSEQALARATEFAAKTGVAFDISAGQAGEGLAKLQTSAGLTQDQVERLAGTINHLSNNMAAKAPEILDAATRVGGIGKAAGLSAETMAALSTAMIAAGGTAETAATGTKNFVRAIGAGEAATKKQVEAFHKLGLNAVEVASRFSKGGREAEAVIRDVVDRIGKVPGENRLATLIQLFGSETIGTIGPLATNIDLLTKSFSLATDEAAALTSVQKEYDSRSKTTANSIQLLKNNVSALAIDLGSKLLPYINDLIAWITSPEGQDWGKQAAESAAKAVVGLVEVVKGLLDFFGFMSEKLGGATTAVAAFGLAVAALTGPFGLAMAAGVAMGAAIAKALDWVLHRTERAQLKLLELHNKAQAIRLQEQEAERAEQIAESDAGMEQTARDKRAQAAVDLWEQKERARQGVKEGSKEDLAITRRKYRMKEELLAGRFSSGTTFEDRVDALEGSMRPQSATAPGEGGGGGGDDEPAGDDLERFNQLAAARKGRQLKPSEAKELRTLSKRLDLAIPKLPGKGRQHKQTKMDRQLANMDKSVSDVITRGGEADAGGDAKVADNALDRAVYQRATHGAGGAGGSSIGAGPNITTNIYNNTVSVSFAVDARGHGSTADNLRSVATDVAQTTARYVFTGHAQLLAAKHSGGRLKS